MDEDTFCLEGFDAVVLDLDGVITRTAEVHAAAWKTMFDDFLAGRAGPDGEYRPFDIDTDYAEHVDGKPRYDGVRDFLRSRGIELPDGDPDDPPGAETVCGLGNRKNRLFLDRLRTGGVKVYDSSVAFIRALRRAGMKLAVVSSSRNCREVLQAAGIEDFLTPASTARRFSAWAWPASRNRTCSWRRRAGSGARRQEPWESRTRSPVCGQPGPPVSAASSA